MTLIYLKKKSKGTTSVLAIGVVEQKYVFELQHITCIKYSKPPEEKIMFPLKSVYRKNYEKLPRLEAVVLVHI